MSRTMKIGSALVAAGCVVGSLKIDVHAQTTGKKSVVRPIQDEEDETPRPATKNPSKSRPPANGKTEGKSTAGEQPRLERPAAQPMRIQVTPEMDKVLKDWEFHSSKFQRLVGDFTRYKYDSVFEVEFRASGSFAYEAPDKGNYELEGIEITKGMVSKKVNEKTGKPWTLKSDISERWVCNGQEVLKINASEKTYEKVGIPEESQGKNIIDGPLPFLFGMKAEQAKRRYKSLTLIKQTEKEIWMKVEPRWPQDAVNWHEAVVIINAETFLPRAVKLIDPTGNVETVHTFMNLQMNNGNGIIQIFQRNPFKPNLNNYKLVLNQAGNAPGLPNGKAAGTPGTKSVNTGNAAGKASTATRPDQALPRSADASGAMPSAAKKKTTK